MLSIFETMSLLSGTRRIKSSSRGHGPIKRFAFLCWALLMQINRQIEKKIPIGKLASTILAFHAFLLISPLFIISFFVLGFCRKMIKSWISWKEADEDMEIVDVTFRTATIEASDQNSVLTTVFALDGILEEQVIKQWLRDLIERRKVSGEGRTTHSYFKCKLVTIKGFFVWKYCLDFNLDDHVILAPSHHHGRTLTDRNVQEYISEMCSGQLPDGHPPWQVQLVKGVAEVGDPVTWVVFRMHHLLATKLNLPEFPLPFPNPWDSVSSTRIYALLDAPCATKKVIFLMKNWLFQKLKFVFQFSDSTLNWFLHKYYKVLHHILFDRQTQPKRKLSESLLISILSFMSFPKELVRNLRLQDFLLYLKILKFWFLKFLFILILCSASILYGLCCHFASAIRSFTSSLSMIVQGGNSHFNLLLESVIEIYWMTRAMFSIPRLLIEEILATGNTVPLHIWRRKTESKSWKRTIVSWSDDIPLEGAKGIQGVSGASLSSVLITALSGGIRDLLRCSGALTPDCLRCTLPVKSPLASPYRGIMPIPLPTGCSYGQKALREVSKSLDRMKKYPETCLASAWLLENSSKFLPEIFIRHIVKFLTRCHPILLINLIGPPIPLNLWGLHLKSTFYWRPPIHDAVISVCISSYCGRVSLGVLADGWSVPHAHSLPQSFASHLNELAVESGVKLQRRNSKSLSNPNISPQSTPTANKVWTSLAYPISSLKSKDGPRKKRKLKFTASLQEELLK